jgi:ABC-type multidrug transport system ATPase subunit
MPLLLQSTKQVNVYMKVSQAQAILIIVFDKVTILYEGRQIYFGRVESAKQYFINQGWQCLERQTTADFLTAVTGPYPSFLPNYRPHGSIPTRRF